MVWFSMVWYGFVGIGGGKGGVGGHITSEFIHEEISIMDWTTMDYHGLLWTITD